MSTKFNALYLQARKNVRVTKRGPGCYAGFYGGLKIMALGKKSEQAVMNCAMLAAKELSQ